MNHGGPRAAKERWRGCQCRVEKQGNPSPHLSPQPTSARCFSSPISGPQTRAGCTAISPACPTSLFTALRRDELPNRHFRIGLEYELFSQTLQNASCSPFRSKVSSKLLFYASKISHFPRRQCHRLTEPKHMLEKTSCDLLLRDEGIRAVYKVMILMGWW